MDEKWSNWIKKLAMRNWVFEKKSLELWFLKKKSPFGNILLEKETLVRTEACVYADRLCPCVRVSMDATRPRQWILASAQTDTRVRMNGCMRPPGREPSSWTDTCVRMDGCMCPCKCNPSSRTTTRIRAGGYVRPRGRVRCSHIHDLYSRMGSSIYTDTKRSCERVLPFAWMRRCTCLVTFCRCYSTSKSWTPEGLPSLSVCMTTLDLHIHHWDFCLMKKCNRKKFHKNC
jgi:hypothetical protein